MRRLMSTVAVAVTTLLLTGLPALAAEGPSRPISAAKGSFGGVLVAMVIGVFFGAIVTLVAYRQVRFGQHPSHAEQAHDVRGGIGGHAVPEPGLEDMPSGGGS
ncbi:MAG TPA: hypothetical protein VHF25_09690 [Nitriliruptorales bacterium]|nr:hypothetical protein [Nitriliruptorales bacterium]